MMETRTPTTNSRKPEEAEKVTVMGAVVLALLGVIVHCGVAVFLAVEWLEPTAGLQPLWFTGNVLIIGTLGLGAVLLLMRRPVGRRLITTGATVAIVLTGIEMTDTALAFARTAAYEGDTRGFLSMGLTFLSVALAGATATLVLALVPPTARWTRRGG